MRARNQDDHDAWDEFVEVYKRFIYHVLGHMNVCANDIDDVAQNILLRLWRKLGTYDPQKARFRTWLCSVIRNIVFNHFAKSNRDHEGEHQVYDDPVSQEYFESTPQSEIDNMIESEWILHLSNIAMDSIRKLFSGHAIAVFELSLDGFDNGEISSKLDIKHDSVKVLKSRVNSRYISEVKRLIRKFEEC